MRALSKTLVLLLGLSTAAVDTLVEQIVCALAKQSVERIARVREVSLRWIDGRKRRSLLWDYRHN